MCQKCVLRAKNRPSKLFKYGKIKALAQSFHATRCVGMYDRKTNIAVEAHLYKIQQALTKRRYKRANDVRAD